MNVGFTYDDDELDVDVPECIVQEAIHIARTNSKLKKFGLFTNYNSVDWELHLPTLFKGLKNHKELRTLMVNVNVSAFGAEFSLLRQFLSDNRNITVTNAYETIYSDDGGVIDELYSLNRFYRASAELVVKPLSKRASLVATTSMNKDSNDFQRSALLLSNHTDALYELIQDAHLAERCDEDFPSPPSIQGNVPKRRRRFWQ